MLQIRLHGRGGQGVVTAAEMLSLSAFFEGAHAQAFPSFGSERTGAPVVAYARIDDKEIRTHEPILCPNAVLVQDRTLLTALDVFAGLDDDGYAIINTKEAPEDIVPELVKRLPAGHVYTVPATDFAMQKIGKPLPGAPILAAMAAVTGIFKLESVQKSFQTRYPGKVGDANAETAALAYEFIMNVKNGGTNA
ncbi:2-oxoacid:acceptor oxidoreductase family protein [Anaerobiospirillum sp. NML120449]|uniref:2-oxoacid:acceptor oxidoreductase family protein n=1 Tax=Anaerobiospirillum sp. NML120449 TaxID=2932817 RepID=UPI001FF5CE46|nr:2-oxoacid:acceptor oxidoreductase family protein [Anaerobiospirillum sp. NML120449]MCK0527652.1 2-oxoacid:acceptor oxidoreductase family protein [Anaerobiospirillum sp. NML120449]